MNDPIAIIGFGLRFPGGVKSPGEFWQLLLEGRDAVTELQNERWNLDYFFHPRVGMPGKTYTKAAGQLDEIWSFDAGFFGISPREAGQIDPQQRLLLEMAWEAFEDAGLVPSQLRGSNTGVFIGISSTDFANDHFDDLASANAYFMTGSTLSIAANRISYLFDLQGPSMAIDTACSSSLVALNQACQSLWSGAAELAICGGVNALLSPFPFVGFCQASMLSPQGRCKAFDASGRGYVRSEGGAVVVLKPLAQARADGDPIHAVILGIGSNCDGRTAGVSLPNSVTQQDLMRRVYQEVELDPGRIAYVEMHGTGTAAGDPVEAGAVGRVIGSHKSADNPLLIGSVKTNIGHLEAASGMAGLIKAILCLRHKLVPPSLHFSNPNPNIPFAELNLRVVTSPTSLSDESGPCLIGVNSFGFGGANAHVLLSEYIPETEKASEEPESIAGYLVPLFISARSQQSLRRLAVDYHALVTNEAITYSDIVRGAALCREHHSHRLAVCGKNRTEVANALDLFVIRSTNMNICQAQCHLGKGRIVGVFSGNGAQWLGMGRCLFETEPRFRYWVEKVDDVLSLHTHWSVVDELFASEAQSRLAMTDVAQPLLFAIQVALWEFLCARGVTFAAVLGHSVGEIAAAYAAGILDLHDAIKVIFERSRLQQQTQGQGRMAAAALSAEDARVEVGKFDGRVEVAAVNSPKSVTLAGSLADLQALESNLEARNVFFRILDLDYAFHSRAMEPIEQELRVSLQGLRPKTRRLRFVSAVTGNDLEGPELNAQYWWFNVRRPVRFHEAVTTLVKEGYEVLLELGPHAILQYYLNETVRGLDASAVTLAALDKKESEDVKLARLFGLLYTQGGKFDFQRLYRGAPNRHIPLPSYPWSKERHRYEATPESLRYLHGTQEHPFLGCRRSTEALEWQGLIDTVLFPWLADHRVNDTVIFPAAAFAEMAFAASASLFGKASPAFEHLEILRPLELLEKKSRIIRLVLNSETHSFQISSRGYLESGDWLTHVTGKLLRGSVRPIFRADTLPLSSIRSEAHYQATDYYGMVQRLGLNYGPAFQGIHELWSNTEWAWAKLQMQTETDGTVYWLHPSLLDGCFQTLFAILTQLGHHGEECLYLPTVISDAVLLQARKTPRFCAAHLKRVSVRSVVADFLLYDEDLTPVARLCECRFRRMEVRAERSLLPTLYRFQPVLCNQPNALTLQDNTDMESRMPTLQSAMKKVIDPSRLAFYQNDVEPLLDALVGAFAYQSFAPLMATGETLNWQQIQQRGGFVDDQEAFLRFLLGIVEEDGYLIRMKEGWSINPDKQIFPAEDTWRLLLAEHPTLLPELIQLGRCGCHLSAVLRGEMDPGLVASSPESAVFDHLRDNSVSLGIINEALRTTITEFVRQRSMSRRLKLLHLGSGQLELVQGLLSVLPRDGFDYVYAGHDEHELARLESEFGNQPNISIRRFDEIGELAGPYDLGGPFDLVVGWEISNVMDRISLGFSWIRDQLRADGLVLLLERCPTRSLDLVAGVQPSWWQRSLTKDRPVSHALPAEAWLQTLAESGYQAVELLSPQQVPLRNGVLLAAWPAEKAAPAAAIQESTGKGGDVLVLSDDSEVGLTLAQAIIQGLCHKGYQVHWARTGHPTDAKNPGFHLQALEREDFHRLLTDLEQQHNSPRLVVNLLGLQTKINPEEMDPLTGEQQRCLAVMNLVQALEAMPGINPPSLFMVTAGALPYPAPLGQETLSIPSQWTLSGLRRVLANEYPALNCRLVDLQDVDLQEDTLDALVRELDTEDGEDEVILAGQFRYGLRLRTVAPESLGKNLRTKSSSDIQLDFTSPGALNNLQWRIKESRPISRDEIKVEVRATGLNFRDVMWAMGLLQDEAVEDGFAGPTLGMECSGVVAEVGEDVKGFRPGDEVVCFAPSCFANRVTANTTATALKPQSLSFEAAATIPSAFFTVYYALHHLAQLQPGEKVLIHGAAGGVGLAAIQYAWHVGAEVFATAGTPEKRDFLKLLGVEHVYDSRSLEFADAILDTTEGVDVVLNSLAGEAIERNLRVLRPFGRFLELGKRDFYADSKIGLRPFRNNISYFGIDADQLLTTRPTLAKRLFQAMMTLFEEGSFRPLPYRVFPPERVKDAFRTMQQSRHIGKIVVLPNVSPEMAVAPNPPAAVVDTEAAYLITGGLGGFGLATARWLSLKGARHLFLLGRSAAPTAETQTVLDEMAHRGTTVRVLQADVVDRSQLAATLQEIRATGLPLRGVIHAAMVLDDGLLSNLDSERFLRVLRPKVKGAWNLHQLTLEDALDFFVLYSSATTYLGNPGQANYVAANAYLEGLAEYRRDIGLPALAVAWGAIGDVGVVAKNEKLRESLASRTGLKPLPSSRALAMLDRLIGSGTTSCAVVDLDWSVIQRTLPTRSAARFAEAMAGAATKTLGDVTNFRDSIAELTAEQIKPLVETALREQVGKVLRLPADHVDLTLSLQDLGMDSLMTAELAMEIERHFGVPFSSMIAAAASNLSETAARITTMLAASGEEGGSVAATSENPLPETLKKHGIELETDSESD